MSKFVNYVIESFNIALLIKMNTTISIHFRNLFAQNFVNTVENDQFYLYVLNFFASTDCCSKKTK
jgi:hypothetical protein